MAKKTESYKSGIFYEDLTSWVASSIVGLIAKGLPTRFGDMKDQLERAALSTTNNIAEACARLQASTKNGKHLFASAKGSAFETHNMLNQAMLLFKNDFTPESRRLIEFGKRLIELVSHELEKLVDAPERSSKPQDIRVFSQSDAAFLREIYADILTGRNINYLVLSRHENKAAKINREVARKRYQCQNCLLTDFSRGEGRIFKIPGTSTFLKKTLYRASLVFLQKMPG